MSRRYPGMMSNTKHLSSSKHMLSRLYREIIALGECMQLSVKILHFKQAMFFFKTFVIKYPYYTEDCWGFFFFRSETVVERMLSNWMSICLYQYLKVRVETSCLGFFLSIVAKCAALSISFGMVLFTFLSFSFQQDNAGEPLYKLFKAIKHQVEKGPVDAVLKKAKYTLNDTGLLGDDVEYTQLVSGAWIIYYKIIFSCKIKSCTCFSGLLWSE